jgi:hypothetical protein
MNKEIEEILKACPKIALKERTGSRYKYKITDPTGSIDLSGWMSLEGLVGFLTGYNQAYKET